MLSDNSAEDRREYLESLLRESKKEEAAPVLHDDAVNDLIARRYMLSLGNISTCFRFSFFCYMHDPEIPSVRHLILKVTLVDEYVVTGK